MQSRILFLLCALIFLSCLKKRRHSISGHFVSPGYFTKKSYNTLDIHDSTIWIDKMGRYGYEVFLSVHNDTFSLYTADDVSEFILDNDTIKFLNNSFYETIFVRIDSFKTFRDDVLCDLAIDVDLPDVGSNKFRSFHNKYLISYVSIGKLKKGYYSDLEVIKADSFLVQVNDVFIELSDLPKFINAEKTKLDSDDRDKMILCVNADRSAPQSLLDEVTKTIRNSDDHIKIYRTFINWKTRKVSYGILN